MGAPARGRPRSEPARRAVLEATRDLLLERGYDRTTIIAIAERAGVGKQTVYRWWPTKPAIVAECVAAGVLPFTPEVVDRSGGVVEALRRWVGRSFERLSDPDQLALFRAFTAAAAAAPAPASLERTLTGSIRAALVELLGSAADAGALRPGVSVDAAADLLLGAMVLRVLTGGAADPAAAGALLDAVLHGVLRGDG